MTQSLCHAVQLQMRYHAWATQEMWTGLAKLPEGEFERARGTSFDTLHATLLHMFQADCVWLERLRGNGKAQLSNVAAPELSALRQAWLALTEELTKLADGMTDDDIDKQIEYANSAGAQFKTPAWQIFMHVANHSTGHRGQVNGLIREAGGQPANTDLIRFYREQADLKG